MRPAASPTTTGSTPDSTSATQLACGQSEVEKSVVDTERRGQGGERHQCDCDDERTDRQVMGVDRGDHHEAHDVVDDGQREYEAA